jgi:hypothetical protein
MKWDTIWVLITIRPLVVRGLMSILTAISHPTRPSALSWPTIAPAVASGSITGLTMKSITMDNYFGYKKGKVYLEDPSTEKKKTCKVISWFMDPTTGESTIRFVVPKLNSRDYTLTVTNKVGTAETTFTIEP